MLANMTLALAIVGALTGLAALLAQVWQFAVSGPRVKVSASQAITTADGQWHLGIDLTNVGRLPVTINDVGVLVETPSTRGRLIDRYLTHTEKMTMVGLGLAHWSGPPLPHRIIDGEAATYLLRPAVVALGLASNNARKDARVYAKLATNKMIKSNRLKRIDVMALALRNAPGGTRADSTES
jgi:hypothetical protein